MGRHATVAANNPTIKSDATITEDDAILKALWTGESAEDPNLSSRASDRNL